MNTYRFRPKLHPKKRRHKHTRSSGDWDDTPAGERLRFRQNAKKMWSPFGGSTTKPTESNPFTSAILKHPLSKTEMNLLLQSMTGRQIYVIDEKRTRFVLEGREETIRKLMLFVCNKKLLPDLYEFRDLKSCPFKLVRLTS